MGQEALARTLTNAFASGRIAHAFLLAGIRGVGKTTTARIIARALNCTGPDGQGGPTPEPCGMCPSCQAIADEHPLDVIEMDAATRTGIDDIREIVDGVRYAPSSSRYKVYIIDEVHMLSEKAFNGLLKTLEEPPPHAKFVFATTEPRKLPVTVLSRCQRFDLRRVETERLAEHLASIAAREGVTAEPAALLQIAAAADGSVRDALSLLDQAMALAGEVRTGAVGAMLGLADRAQLRRLMAALMEGRTEAVLEIAGQLYALGAEPDAVVTDLLTLAHECSRRAALPERGEPAPEGLEAHAGPAALPSLARAWQMLLKGLEEIRGAPDAQVACEMLLLRVACVAPVPPPAELARLLAGGTPAPAPPAARAAAPAGPRPASQGDPEPSPAPPPTLVPMAAADAPEPVVAAPTVVVEAAPPPPPAAAAGRPADDGLPSMPEELATAPPTPDPAPDLGDGGAAGFAALLKRLRAAGEAPLVAYLEEGAHLIRFGRGTIELRPSPNLTPNITARLREAASRVTGEPWAVALSDEPGLPTIAEARIARRKRRIEELAAEPAWQALLQAFPGASIVDVRPMEPTVPVEPTHIPPNTIDEVERT